MKRFHDFFHYEEHLDDRLRHLEHPAWARFDSFMMAVVLIILALGLFGLLEPML